VTARDRPRKITIWRPSRRSLDGNTAYYQYGRSLAVARWHANGELLVVRGELCSRSPRPRWQGLGVRAIM